MSESDRRAAEVALGPIGTGIYFLCNWLAPGASDFQKQEQGGPLLADWSLAINEETDDLIFIKTKGYHSGYLALHPAPGGACFLLKDYMLKSRDSDAKFTVLYASTWQEEGPDARCTRDDLVEFSRWWNGYELTGDEKKYYLTLIQAIKQREEDEANAQYKAQEEQLAKNIADYPNGISGDDLKGLQEQLVANYADSEDSFPRHRRGDYEEDY